MHAGAKAPHLAPLFCAWSRQEFEAEISAGAIKELKKIEESLRPESGKPFSVRGFCIPCRKTVSFQVDMQAGGREEEGSYFPNWRERLICSSCRMSNRQRLVATLVGQHLELCPAKQEIYLMERTSPLYKWVSDKYRENSIVGSEYLGADRKSGSVVGPVDYQISLQKCNSLDAVWYRIKLFYLMLRLGGLRHEDISRMSFPDASFDVIVSNDVFEHVPDLVGALKECARVLRQNGIVLATIPFHGDKDNTVIRARQEAGGIRHILPTMYHGNPISPKGSLVFTDFGWDIFQLVRMAGFSDGRVEVYGDARYGHLGDGQLVFRLIK